MNAENCNHPDEIASTPVPVSARPQRDVLNAIEDNLLELEANLTELTTSRRDEMIDFVNLIRSRIKQIQAEAQG